jgi:hypothetical protein
MNDHWMNDHSINDPSAPQQPTSADQVDPFPSSIASNPGVAFPPGTSTSAALHLKPEDAVELRHQAERELVVTLCAAAERVRYITSASGVALALCESEADEMVCRGGSGPVAPEVGTRMNIHSGITAESIRTRQTLRCDEASTDSRVNQETCKALGIESVMVMPLIVGRAVVGIFELFGAHPSAFGERDAKALQGTASGVQFALERAVNAGVMLGHIPWATIPEPLPETAPETQTKTETKADVSLVESGSESVAQFEPSLEQSREAIPPHAELEQNTDKIPLRVPVVFPISRLDETHLDETGQNEIHSLEQEEPVPAFLARLADEAKPASTKRWSQWFRPQW